MQSKSQIPHGQLLLYFSRVFEPDAETEASLLTQFSTSERARLDSIKSFSRRLEFLSSRILMRQAMNEIFSDNQHAWEFEEQSNSCPLITNLPSGFHINLSHSKGIICFAVADMPVGIDIEACERDRDFNALGKMFMNDSEHERLATQVDPSTYFYRCWCVKEAYYKAHPQAEQENLHFTGIAVEDIDQVENDWYLTEGKVEDHYLVAASRFRPSRVQCHYFPGGNAWPQPFTPIES